MTDLDRWAFWENWLTGYHTIPPTEVLQRLNESYEIYIDEHVKSPFGPFHLMAYTSALYLFIHGRLDVVYDVFDLWLPEERPDRWYKELPKYGHLRYIAFALAHMTPYPDRQFKIDEPKVLRKWYHKYGHKLVWVEETKEYKFKPIGK